MCEPTTIMMVAGAAISGMSAISQGQQAKATGNYVQAQAQADASATNASALLEAQNIRAAGKRQRSAANAAQAAAGVSVGEGTAEVINQEIDFGAEKDAQIAILTGNTRGRQMLAQGQAAKIGGDNAARAGYLSAASSAMRAGSSAGGGWKSTAEPLSWMQTSNRGMGD